MCLRLRTENSNKPYNESKIRWKVAERANGNLVAPYAYTIYDKTQWMVAKNNSDKFWDFFRHTDIGFHVFVTRKDARNFRTALNSGTVIRVEVDGLVASGYFGDRRSETWNRMRILP
jgi:hypothetical protein